MGRPDDLRRKRELKELEELRTKDQAQIGMLKDILEKQGELIDKFLSGSSTTETVSTGGLTKEDLLDALSNINIGSDILPEDPNKPKVGDFYINPSEEMKVKNSNLDRSSLEEKKVSSDNSDVEKLKRLLGKREDDK